MCLPRGCIKTLSYFHGCVIWPGQQTYERLMILTVHSRDLYTPLFIILFTMIHKYHVEATLTEGDLSDVRKGLKFTNIMCHAI